MRVIRTSTNQTFWLLAALAFLICPLFAAQGGDMKLQATLVWATDDSKPPEGKTYTPVEPEIRNKIHDLPLKWKNYFEVSRTNFSVTPIATKKAAVSPKCEVEVKNLGTGNSEVEVVLIGKGKEVMRRKQSLPRGELLVLGGNAPNATAWLVTLKRVE